VPLGGAATALTVPTMAGRELVASVPTPDGRWWVLFRQPAERVSAAADAAVSTIYTGLLALLALTAILLWQSQRWVDRRSPRRCDAPRSSPGRWRPGTCP
jgi:hypothetical protein